ncbi:MAG: tetratricopeptide repeat protein [Candidatus Eisenbacteria bacterium]|uniref:Tetratricopeptide repeat protein n=1 Tax=Eiseniibacteriota bacterium TaxID=2212470 RepID=A0A956RNX3_UNCEI|nr:tetratricopeptide repeat protein [Candidatus Eisenbacteria bacterium]
MNATHHPNRHRAGAGVALLMLAGTLFTSGCALFRSGGDGELTARDEPTALQQAIDWATQQASAVPDEPYWPHHLAELYVRSGRGDDAEHALHDALARDPRYAPSLTLLSRLLYQDGRFGEGLELLSSVPIDSFPRGEACVLAADLALHREALGDPEAARRTLEPYRADIDWKELGSVPTYLELRGDDFLDAKVPAERALDAQEDAVNLNNHGIARLLAGDPETARREFQRAHTLDPDLPGPLYNLAIVERFYFFDDKAAQGYFDQYASLSSEDPDGLRLVFQTDAQSRVVRDEEAER